MSAEAKLKPTQRCPTLPAYIIYLIDWNGRMRHGRSLDCAGDAEATKRFVAADREGDDAELWLGGRLVAKISRDGVLSTPDGPKS